MSAAPSRAAGCAVVAVLGMIGLCTGLVTGHLHPLPGQETHNAARAFPLPHHVPKYEGGITLRFAMVHDVLHERFPRHGEVYYEERNRRAREAVAAKQD